MVPQVLPAHQASGASFQAPIATQSEDSASAKVPWYKTRVCKVIMVGQGFLAAAAAVAAFLAGSFVTAGILGAVGLVCLSIPLYQTIFAPKALELRTVSAAPQIPAYTVPESLQQPVQPTYYPVTVSKPDQPIYTAQQQPLPQSVQSAHYSVAASTLVQPTYTALQQPLPQSSTQPAHHPVAASSSVQPPNPIRVLTNYNGHTLKHYDLSKGSNNQFLQNVQPCRPIHNPVEPIIMPHPDGAAGVAREYLKNNQKALIALGIAGNSGKPGGGLQNAQYQFNSSQVSPKARGQEEALFSEWLINECGAGNSEAQRALFENTVWGQWGFIYGQSGKTTIQGRDYTTLTDPAGYKDAWSLSNIPINQFGQKVGYIVVAGPNTCVNTNDKTGEGSMANTLNERAQTDYTFFKECVRQALITLFISARAEGYDVMLVPQISCGIYAGPWRNAMTGTRQDPATGITHSDFSQGDFFREILPSVLSEKIDNDGLTIGHLFNEVIVPALPPKTHHGSRRNRNTRAGRYH